MSTAASSQTRPGRHRTSPALVEAAAGGSDRESSEVPGTVPPSKAVKVTVREDITPLCGQSAYQPTN